MIRFRCAAGLIPLTVLSVVLTLLAVASPARAVQFFVMPAAGTTLERYDSAAPGVQISAVSITGMQVAEKIAGIDYRPADGQLFGLSDQSRLYKLNPLTGVATQVGTGTFPIALTGTAFGIDFVPTADRLRVVSNSSVNMRLNPDTAAQLIDTPLSYAAGDPNVGASPAVVAVAYTNNAPGATVTTAYGIDRVLDVLVRIGGADGSPSANAGVLTTVGPLGIDVSTSSNLDIGPDGIAYGALLDNGSVLSKLYAVNLTTGAVTLVGTIGTGAELRGLAVAPVGQVEFNAATGVVAEAAGTAMVTVLRKAGSFGEITVQYATSNGTATAGSDYTATSGTLTFDVDETSKSFTIPITNDTTDEADETITVTLSNPGGGATIGATSVLTLSITDDDAPASVIPGITCGTGACGAGMFTMLPAMALALRARRRGRR